jgi:hypothetical protein
MSTPTTPPHDALGPAGDPGPSQASTPRRGASRVRPDADFELMLALRGAAHARDLRNRVVRPRSVETRDAAGPGPEGGAATDRPRDLAHPN